MSIGMLCGNDRVCLRSAAHAELTAPASYRVGTSPDPYIPNAAPASEVAEDLDGDGKLDLVVTHRSDDSIYFLKGNGDGSFKTAVRIPVGSPIQGNLYVGDFNGDGKSDLFLPGAKGQAIVLPGNGDGTFKAAVVSSSFNLDGYYPRGWAVGKFTGGGKLNIAFTLPTNAGKAARYGVVPGNGDGTFGKAILGPGDLIYSRWIVPGDFNRDGKTDLAVADGHGSSSDPGTARMAILLGNGDGTFQRGENYPSPQFPSGDGWQDANAVGHPENIVVADLTGRGILDVIVSDYSSTINVFMGNGDGTFRRAVSYNPGNYPRNVMPVDIDRDGKIDLVVNNVGIGIGGAIFQKVGAQSGSICILSGNGDGTFRQPIVYNPSAFPGYTLAADFNGDGHPDLATTQVFDGNVIHVMLNKPNGKNLPPTFVNPPSAEMQGMTAHLSALGEDDDGAEALVYAWSTIGPVPARVDFGLNGTNAAQNTKGTFTKSGQYVLQCKITDKQGISVIKLVVVKVP
ncbi:MAG: VCBS repeat-containing protein [Pirellulales bacterium]